MVFILGFSQVQDSIELCLFSVKHQGFQTLRLENLQIKNFLDICDAVVLRLYFGCNILMA